MKVYKQKTLRFFAFSGLFLTILISFLIGFTYIAKAQALETLLCFTNVTTNGGGGISSTGAWGQSFQLTEPVQVTAIKANMWATANTNQVLTYRIKATSNRLPGQHTAFIEGTEYITGTINVNNLPTYSVTPSSIFSCNISVNPGQVYTLGTPVTLSPGDYLFRIEDGTSNGITLNFNSGQFSGDGDRYSAGAKGGNIGSSGDPIFTVDIPTPNWQIDAPIALYGYSLTHETEDLESKLSNIASSVGPMTFILISGIGLAGIYWLFRTPFFILLGIEGLLLVVLVRIEVLEAWVLVAGVMLIGLGVLMMVAQRGGGPSE